MLSNELLNLGNAMVTVCHTNQSKPHPTGTSERWVQTIDRKEYLPISTN